MSVSRYKYEDIVRIISEINELHYSFSIQLSNLLSFNLKNTISSVVANNSINSDFQELVNSYKKELNSIVGGISDIQNKFVGIRYRIKQAESISEKLLYYMTDVHEFGKVPLNKCLNDLLGFRILVIDLESVYATLKHDDRVTSITKMYLRTDGGYSGIHLYFKNGNNKFFPWELQIWDIEQSSLNEISHREHKQKRKYIYLPQNYHEAKLEKED